MQKYTHVKYDEKNLFKVLLLTDNCKKKNSKINLSEISRQTVCVVNIVKREINRFKKVEDYMQVEAQKDYKQKRKKCIKKIPTFTEEQ